MRTVDRTLCAATLALAMLAPSAFGSSEIAWSAVRFEAEVEPTSISFPGLATITYRLRMTTGLTDEQFSVTLRQPRFAEGGSPVVITRLAADVSLTGPGRIGLVRTEEPLLICARDRAYGPLGATFDIYLPAASTTVLSARFQTGRAAPFTNTDYRLTFLVSPTMMAPGETSTLDREETLVSPGPQRTGKTGVLMRLGSTPAGLNPAELMGLSPPASERARSRGKVRRGQTVVFRGTTTPILRNQRIALRYRGPGSSRRMRSLPPVRTDNRGRFRAVWKPRAAGGYAFWVFYRSQRRGLVSDRTSCPLTYEVR